MSAGFGQTVARINESVRESTQKLLARLETFEDRLGSLTNELFPGDAPPTQPGGAVTPGPPSDHHLLMERLHAVAARIDDKLQRLSGHLIG